MASIDAVTASFAASLALADGGRAPDLGKIGGGPVRKSSQVFLLGKPLTRKPIDPKAFMSHFNRTWMVDKEFRIQERAGDLFLFSFASARDRNKILRGGVWCFDRAPVCFEEYDGVKPLHEIPFKHLRIWAKVAGIPPLYEEPENLILIGNLLGGFLDYDKKEFKKGVNRVLFTHDTSKPILLERRVFLDTGVEPVLQFQFEHLRGRCSQCGLVTHAGIACEEPTAVNPTSRVLHFPGGSTSGNSFAFSAKSKGDLLYPSQVIPKKKRPAFRRVERLNSDPPSPLDPVPTEISPTSAGSPLEHRLESTGVSGEEPVMDVSCDLVVPTDMQKTQIDLVSKKRERSGANHPSPKKFKTILGGKIPTLQAEALGLIEEDGDLTLVTLKKRSGRPLGSKNKAQSVNKKFGGTPLKITYPTSIGTVPSPSDKGKGKV